HAERDGLPARDVHGAVRPGPHGGLGGAMARDDRGPAPADLPSAPALHGRSPAGLHADRRAGLNAARPCVLRDAAWRPLLRTTRSGIALKSSWKGGRTAAASNHARPGPRPYDSLTPPAPCPHRDLITSGAIPPDRRRP